jgi:NAD dependent epimerase/dehydratase family enzyme
MLYTVSGSRVGGTHWRRRANGCPWIHLDDLTALIAFLLKESTVRGAFNAVSPHPVTNSEFTEAHGHEPMQRPAILACPGRSRSKLNVWRDGLHHSRQPARIYPSADDTGHVVGGITC